METDAARRRQGVRAVRTGADARQWSRPFVAGVKAPMEQWALAMDRVGCVGEPVAGVVAETRAQAEDAADLVKAACSVLPPAVSIEAALAEDAPVLHPGGARMSSVTGRFARAARKRRLPRRRSGSA